MRQHLDRSIGFFRATAIGGLLLLLPLFIVVGLVGYIYSFVSVIQDPLSKYLPVDTPLGLLTLFVATVALIILLCFAAGLLAHRAIGIQVSRLIERYLSTIFPKYTIYKDLLAGNIGGKQHLPSLKPVLVRVGDELRPAFETDRLQDQQVVVFFPGAPDSWIGHVSIVAPDRVRSLDLSFNDAIAMLEQLGRGSGSRISL